MFDISFYKEKTILITGHTGFKGTWMCKVLADAGANVIGYALAPPAGPNIFKLSEIEKKIVSVTGDIRNIEEIKQVFINYKPEIVIHMAAQPIVRESYSNPVYTYDVNVMGTVNVLECVRQTPSVRSFLNVTTDKVYLNKEWEWGYRENEELNGYDPYSNSKSCSELVTSSYRNSFFKDGRIAVSTARAGNVIGGGDFSKDRIIPDCIRAVQENRDIIVRNPYSVRPYQHVLESVMAYLMIAKAQYEDIRYADSYNIGPEEEDCLTTGELVTLFCRKWKDATNKEIIWKNEYDGGPHEAEYLKLDCSKLKKTFGWKPVWNMDTAMEKIVAWSKVFWEGEDIRPCMEEQIQEFIYNRIKLY